MYTLKNLFTDIENQNVTLLCIGQGYSREYKGRYNRYRVLVGRDLVLDHYNTDFMGKVAYFNKQTGSMAISCFGMSQEFEAIKTLLYTAMFDHFKEYNHDWFYANCNKVKAIY